MAKDDEETKGVGWHRALALLAKVRQSDMRMGVGVPIDVGMAHGIGVFG